MKNNKVMLYVLIIISVVTVGYFAVNNNRKVSAVNCVNVKGLPDKDHHYCSLFKTKDGRLLLFTNKNIMKDNSLPDNNIVIFCSDDNGKNWQLFKEIEGMECADENDLVALNSKLFLRVHCDSVNFLNTRKSSILCIDVNNKKIELTKPFLDMGRLALYDNKIVFFENGKLLSLDENFKASIMTEKEFPNLYRIVSNGEAIYAYSCYNKYLIDVANNVKYDSPYPIDDIVFCSEKEILFVYSDSDENLCVGRCSLNMDQMSSFKVKGYKFLNGLMSTDSIVVGIAKKNYNTNNEMICSYNKGETWEKLDVEGYISMNYYIGNDSLYVLSSTFCKSYLSSFSLSGK